MGYVDYGPLENKSENNNANNLVSQEDNLEFNKLAGSIVRIQNDLNIVLEMQKKSIVTTERYQCDMAEIVNKLQNLNNVSHDVLTKNLDSKNELMTIIDSIPNCTSRIVAAEIQEVIKRCDEGNKEMKAVAVEVNKLYKKFNEYPDVFDKKVENLSSRLDKSVIAHTNAIDVSASKYRHIGTKLGFYALVIFCNYLAYNYWLVKMHNEHLWVRGLYLVGWFASTFIAGIWAYE